MELTKEQQGRLDYAKEQLHAESAYVAPASIMTQLHENYEPIEVPIVVFHIGTFVLTATAETVLASDKKVSGFVFEHQTQEGLPTSPAYTTPPPPAAPPTLKLGREYPGRPGFFLNGGGNDFWALPLGYRATFGGKAYEKVSIPLSQTPFANRLVLWQKVG